MLQHSKVNMIDVGDWDKLVKETYGKPYSFQQQDGCQFRGSYSLTVPPEGDRADYGDGFDRDSIPEEVNGSIMGVSFKAWLERDPKEPIKEQGGDRDFMINLFWQRNFYPSIDILAWDLYERGLIEAGDYIIDIDW